MDLQASMNALGQAGHDTRARYHLTLGRLIEVLRAAAPSTFVVTDQNTSLNEPHSYRGYYSDLCFEPSAEPVTAAELLAICEDANDDTFEGYKGGHFRMGEGTPLWVANYGCCGRAIMGARIDGDRLALTTSEEND